MAPHANKAADGRRKSGSKHEMFVTLKVSPAQLREIMQPSAVKEESPVEESKEHESPDPSVTPAAHAVSNGEQASDSNVATPAADGTPVPPTKAPPAEGGPKKKGVKRSAPATDTPGDGTPKPRGKPGPKKKPRLYVHIRPVGARRVAP
jgi:hypothetical protein